MNPMRNRIYLSLLVAMLISVGLFAQTGTWQSPRDIDLNERGELTGEVVSLSGDSFEVRPDAGVTNVIRVFSSSSTRYRGLGTNPAATQLGSAGLTQLGIGDRIRVTGIGSNAQTVRAEFVQLLGRAVTSAPATTTTPASTILVVEGVIDDILLSDQSFVLRGDTGETWKIVGTRETPVVFEGSTYQLGNLERGDRVRVDVDRRLASGELRASRIEVLEDSTPDGETPSILSNNYLTGRVGRIESRGNRFVFRSDRAGEILIEAGRAVDAKGEPFRTANIQVGDRLRIWGEYTADQRFRADRVEVGTAADATASDQLKDRGQEPYLGFSTVILSGTVEKNPPNEDKITIHNRNERRDLEITVDEEFIVLRPDDTFIRASQLRQGDNVVIKAFRDPRGEYIAQTIRLQAR
ncbi:MAG: DUF5666 domain-containing protein [Thermoanaerobaculia bacterium]